MDLAGRAAGSTGEHASVQPAAVARYWARAASVGARDARFRNQDPGQSQPDARWRNHSGPGCHCGSIVVLCGDVIVGADQRQGDELPGAVEATAVTAALRAFPPP